MNGGTQRRRGAKNFLGDGQPHVSSASPRVGFACLRFAPARGRFLLPWCLCALMVGNALAGNIPGWWTTPGTQIIQTGATENNYALVNSGQLKYVAYQAKAYLDAN